MAFGLDRRSWSPDTWLARYRSPWLSKSKNGDKRQASRRRTNTAETFMIPFCSSGGCFGKIRELLPLTSNASRIGHPATLTPLKSAECPGGEETCSCPLSGCHTQTGKRQALLEDACHLPCCHISEARINQSPPALPHHYRQNPCPDLHEMMLGGRAGRRTGSDTRLDSVSVIESESICLPVPVRKESG